MKSLTLVLIGCAFVLSSNTTAAQQVFRDEASFLAAVRSVTTEGFEGSPTQDCSTGGSIPATSLVIGEVSVVSEPLDGGTSFLCVGTTSSGGPTPTEGNNALVAGSTSFDRWRLTFTIRGKPIAAVGFYLTDVAEQGDALFSTGRGDEAVIASCCGAGETIFFGFISDKPFKEFFLTNMGIGDGWGIDELMLVPPGGTKETAIGNAQAGFPQNLFFRKN